MADGDQRFTESGIPVQVVYGPADLAGFDLIAARPLKGVPTAAFRFERGDASPPPPR